MLLIPSSSLLLFRYHIMHPLRPENTNVRHNERLRCFSDLVSVVDESGAPGGGVANVTKMAAAKRRAHLCTRLAMSTLSKTKRSETCTLHCRCDFNDKRHTASFARLSFAYAAAVDADQFPEAARCRDVPPPLRLRPQLPQDTT